ncbi:DUF1254 domain-containing protein [Phenylobacterium sp.]|uniref:DUF1254 domain-containing protein n=1 Tax=Phenylobacterium sp. TaxID=1871053 RepID=UPI0025F83BA6|nr:DUF1254 domain-containing protein [Phenylobacterium sp.]
MTDLRTAAREAYIYTLPLIEVATTRARGQKLGHQMGVFAHVRALATHKHRAVTTPNNDTLYSTAQIDLSAGPVTITLPPTGDRYFSLALMDAYTNNFAVLGTRTTGPDGGVFRLVGPNEAAEGWGVIRSPTNHVWALARILVDGPHDLDAAREVQAGLSMQGPACEAPGPYAARSADWREYFDAAAKLMAANPPPATDLAALRAIAPLGLAEGFDPARFSEAQAAEIEAGLAEGRKAARGGGGLAGTDFVEGWSYPSARLGDFDQDYAYRAAVALGGLAALPPAEAMYMRAAAPDGRALFDGTKAWRLHFPAGAPLPVNSFWSLSLYEATDDGQFFFTDNPLDRYAIGDRTPGLTANDDGSLDIWIGHQNPGPGREANWLPAPAGPFALFMRAYLPKPDLLEGRYRLPPIEAADS